MRKLAEFTIKYRYVLFVLVLGAVVWLGIQAKHITMNNDMTAWLDHSKPSVKLYMRTGEKFGANYIDMVVLKTRDVFTNRNLTLVRKLTKSFEKIDGVDQVLSLTNILDVKPTPDGLEVKNLIEKGPIPKDPKKLQALKRYVLSKERYRGFMVNNTGSATMLMVRLRLHADKNKVSALILKQAQALTRTGNGIQTYVGGMPVAIYEANKLVSRDMGRLTPIVTLLILLVLFASFRTAQGTLLPLITVILAAISTVGLMALFKVPLTMISASMPVVLLATGTAYGIHLINATRELGMQGVLDAHERVVAGTDKVGLGILMAALTTMFGFGSLATAQLIPIRNMGLFLAVGIFLSLIYTFLLVIPALTVWKVKVKPLPEGRNVSQNVDQGVLSTVLTKIADSVTAHPWSYSVVSGVIALIALFFAFHMTREVNLTNYFPPSNPVRRAEDIMKREFGGATPVVVDFEAKTIKNPAVLRVMQRIQKTMRATPHVKHPSGVVDFMTEMNYVMNRKRMTPSTQQGVDNLWIFIEGKKELSQMLDDPKKEAIVQATIDQSNSKLMADVTREMEARLKHVPRKLVRVVRSKLTPKQREGIARVVTRDALAELKDDLAYAGIHITNEKPVHDVMLDAASGRLLGDAMRQKVVRSAVDKYMMSDSAELEVPQAVADAVADAISGMKAWNKASVLAILKQKIPEKLWKDDPDSLPAMADSLSAVYSGARDGAMVNLAFAALQKYLSRPLKGVAPEVKQRVKADLWELREPTTYVAAGDYEKVMGHPANASAVTKLKVELTGEAKVMTNVNNQLITSQAESLGIAILLVFILMMVQFKSFTGGLLSMIPIVFTILFNFGLMGMFKIPLDNATAMIASAAIGLGIDYTIHVMLRFKKEYEATGDTNTALRGTLAGAGRAVLVNSLAVTLGFLVLLLSSMEPLRRFGYLMAITMVISAVAALTVFPAAVLATRAKFLTRSAGPKEAR